MKSKLLQKSAAPQFPPIPPEEAKKWLLSQGFTEKGKRKDEEYHQKSQTVARSLSS